MNRYRDIEVLRNTKGTQYYRNTFYPEIEPRTTDVYVITTRGDRLDLLASTFYKDSSMYWIIAIANNISYNTLFITEGTQLRIPQHYSEIIAEFQKLNNQTNE